MGEASRRRVLPESFSREASIALIRPRYHTHIITPPLGLAYLAATVNRAGHTSSIVDALRDGLTENQVVRCIEDTPVVGVSCMSDHHRETIRLVHVLKDVGKTVVLGGPHVTALPRESLKETGADAVLLGEAEHTLPPFLETWPRRIPLDGFLYADEDREPVPVLSPDLDALPEPAWERIPPKSYPIAPHGAMVRRFPVAPVISSRGCAFRCTFCTAPRFHHRRVRYRNPGLVLDEIERLVRDFSVREIHFEDNNLTGHLDHIVALCEGLVKRKIRITWACPNGVRTEHLTYELLHLMKRSGCYLLAFGLESGNQEILDRIKKDRVLKDMLEAVNRASKAGILTQGFFIFGLPGEDHRTMENTIRVALYSRLDRAQFHLLDILPGSELWDTMGRQRIGGWERRGFQEVVWVPPGLTEEDLVRTQKRAFRKFYFRFRILASFLKDLKPRQVPFFLRRLADFGLLRRVLP